MKQSIKDFWLPHWREQQQLSFLPFYSLFWQREENLRDQIFQPGDEYIIIINYI